MPGSAHAAQRRHQPVDVPVSMREHDVLDMEQIHRVDETYFQAPDPDVMSVPAVDGASAAHDEIHSASTLHSHESPRHDRVNMGTVVTVLQVPTAVRRNED